MPTYEKADHQRIMPGVRCSARSVRTGEQCKRWAARGANVCPVHGASAPQVKAAAKRRLDQAADVLVQRLLGLALDGRVDDPIALRAIIAALDRAGIVVPNTVDITVGPKPWEQIFDGIAGGSREESRRGRGYVEDPLALDAPVGDDDDAGSACEIVDAELVESNRTPTGSDSDWQGCDSPGADAKGDPVSSIHGDSSKTETRRSRSVADSEQAHQRRPVYPVITGEAAIHEAARARRILEARYPQKRLGRG